jgi:hypothetical protein
MDNIRPTIWFFLGFSIVLLIADKAYSIGVEDENGNCVVWYLSPQNFSDRPTDSSSRYYTVTDCATGPTYTTAATQDRMNPYMKKWVWNETLSEWESIIYSNGHDTDRDNYNAMYDFFNSCGNLLGNPLESNPNVDYPEGPGTCGGQDCVEELEAAAIECGGEEFLDWDTYNSELCTIDCLCTPERQDAEDFCADGYEIQTDCTYTCNDCDDFYQEAVADCEDNGGLNYINCNIINSYDPDIALVIKDHTCNGDYPDTGEGQPPLDPEDPTPEVPDPDPDPDPGDPDSDITNQWLQAIKGNTDTLITQGNKNNNYLDNIDENIAEMVSNQGVLNDSLNRIESKVGNNTEINKNLNDIEDDVENTNNILNSQKYEGNVPSAEDYEFDSTIPDTQDWNEYDNPEDTASTQGQSDGQSIIDQMLSEELPYTAQVTATPDECLNGTLLGQPVSICFNKPWMLQGYAIMKLLFIAIGYVQVAIMLNRALLA